MPFEEDKPPYIYTSIINGKFAVRAKDDDHNEKIVERTNAEGKKVREYQYRSLKNVLLADIQVGKHETYGKSWEFILIDGNQYVLWRASVKGAIGSNFLKMVEGIQLDQPFNIVAGWDKEKERSQVFVSQGEKVNSEGKTVPNYLKSNYPRPPEGETSPCPPGVQTEINGEKVWDYTAQNRFLWEKVVKSLRPFLPGVNREAQQVAQQQSTVPPNVDTSTGEVTPPEPAYLKEQKPQAPPTSQLGNPPQDDETDDLPF